MSGNGALVEAENAVLNAITGIVKDLVEDGIVPEGKGNIARFILKLLANRKPINRTEERWLKNLVENGCASIENGNIRLYTPESASENLVASLILWIYCAEDSISVSFKRGVEF